MAAGGRLTCTTVAILIAASTAGAGSEPLSYVDSSQGLEQPEFEGGDTEFEVGDVNGDGHVDLVSVGDHGNPLVNTEEEGIMVWFGDGRGGWTYGRAGHLGYGGVALGDVNDDGLIDIAYGIHHAYSSTDLGDQLLEVALGDGSGMGWTPWDDRLAEDGQSWGLFSTDFADVNGDGRLDVGATGFGSSDGLHVYLSDGDGTWRRSIGFLHGNSGHVFEFGDVDGDGHADIVTAKQEGTVWLGDGEGFFTVADGNLPALDPFDWRDGPSLGDVDGDGRDDLAYCNASRSAEVWLWRGVGAWEDVSAGVPATATCQHTQLRDMDGDGLVDLVTFGHGRVDVFAGDGTGASWAEIASFGVGLSPGTSSAFRVGGDFDHNGRPDIVLVAEKQISIFDDQNIVRAYRETTVPTALSARIVRPGPHRRLLAGSVGFIDWTVAVPAGSTATIGLELSTTGPDGPWEPIAAALPESGRHQWIVPSQESSECYLRLTASTGAEPAEAVSPAPFTITHRADTLRVTFSSKSDLNWTDDLDRDRHDLYRADWSHFRGTGEYTQDPGVVPQAARSCDLEVASHTDPFVPARGEMVFYLVTGYRLMDDGVTPAAAMAEGTLGQRSGARTRENAHRCPR